MISIPSPVAGDARDACCGHVCGFVEQIGYFIQMMPFGWRQVLASGNMAVVLALTHTANQVTEAQRGMMVARNRSSA